MNPLELTCRCSHPRSQHTAAGSCKRWELGCTCLHFADEAKKVRDRPREAS